MDYSTLWCVPLVYLLTGFNYLFTRVFCENADAVKLYFHFFSALDVFRCFMLDITAVWIAGYLKRIAQGTLHRQGAVFPALYEN